MWPPIDHLHFGPRQSVPDGWTPVESRIEGIFESPPREPSLLKLTKPSLRKESIPESEWLTPHPQIYLPWLEETSHFCGATIFHSRFTIVHGVAGRGDPDGSLVLTQ